MLLCVPVKHDVVWKEGWEEQFNDSDRKPEHQQNYGAKNHLEIHTHTKEKGSPYVL